MFAERYRWDEVPEVEGAAVYALFADAPGALLPVRLGPENLVYVGMAAHGQDARSHFLHEHSGLSTLRRSLGAILKEQLGLVAVPRSPGPSKANIVAYRFAGDGEAALTTWMQEHLRLSVEPVRDNIRIVERDLIARMKPPLCLSGWPNPQGRAIQIMRGACKLEAECNRHVK